MPSRLSTASPPSLPIDPGRLGRDDAVQRGRQQRQLEPVRAERPRDVDVVGIARAPRRNDRDVVEPVRPPGLLAASDLYFHFGIVAGELDDSGAAQRARRDAERPQARGQLRRRVPGFCEHAAQRISAPISSRSASTSPSSRSTFAGSMIPAPKCWVDSAPQATPKRRQSTGGRPRSGRRRSRPGTRRPEPIRERASCSSTDTRYSAGAVVEDVRVAAVARPS